MRVDPPVECNALDNFLLDIPFSALYDLITKRALNAIFSLYTNAGTAVPELQEACGTYCRQPFDREALPFKRLMFPGIVCLLLIASSSCSGWCRFLKGGLQI